MTASDWAFFWHRHYFRNTKRRWLWWVGVLPAAPAMLNNWLNRKIEHLNGGRR